MTKFQIAIKKVISSGAATVYGFIQLSVIISVTATHSKHLGPTYMFWTGYNFFATHWRIFATHKCVATPSLRNTALEGSQNINKKKTLRGENFLTIIYWWQKNNQFTLVHLLVAYGIFLKLSG